jgi:hypothetical protein|nr:MAG TPA: hypothetical protein [Caudoviricetes sp.]
MPKAKKEETLDLETPIEEVVETPVEEKTEEPRAKVEPKAKVEAEEALVVEEAKPQPVAFNTVSPTELFAVQFRRTDI